MNLDSVSIAGFLNPLPARATQGPIAAQACDTCRARKQKCDERRPKCDLCQRMKLDCRYRELQPTKKDKTLVEILDRLKSLEGKIDRIPTRGPVPTGFGPPQPSPTSQPSFSADVDEPGLYLASSLRPSQQPSLGGTRRSQPYRHTSAAHKMLTWPAIQQLLLQARPSSIGDLKSLELGGSAFIVGLQKGIPRLPLDEGLQATPFVGMQTQATRASGAARRTFPALTPPIIHRLAKSYFDTFNFLYPFLDRRNFLLDTMARVQSEGFDDDTDSVIVLLVLALGELSLEGSRGNPIEVINGRPSGIRGGTRLKPPGLALFNEARKRIGYLLTDCDLENVQIFSLAALYYESCSHHLDFWRSTVSASMACQILVTCNPIDWSSLKGELIKRAYWHCVIMESGLHLHLDLPLTGLIDLEDRVDISSFNTSFCEEDRQGNQSSHFKAHYDSQVALRRLCTNLYRNINDYSINNDTDTPSASNNDYDGPRASSLTQLASQLTQWREMLPLDLQWAEDDPVSFPNSQQVGLGVFNQPLDSNLSQQPGQSSIPLFSPDLDSEPVQYPDIYHIQVALLRTRYYYAKYMVYRPFVYKALHFPEQMTQEDAEGVAECLRSCLKWPLTLSPTSRHKRLVPDLFCWSQNLLGILLIIHMTQHNPMLRDIRAHLCGARFEAEIDQTVEIMLDWIRDLKTTDSIAMWCWKILQGVYHLEG